MKAAMAKIATALIGAAALGGCVSIHDHRGSVIDTELVSAIQPSIEIADMAAELARQGLGRPVIVSPGEVAPPRPGRSAA